MSTFVENDFTVSRRLYETRNQSRCCETLWHETQRTTLKPRNLTPNAAQCTYTSSGIGLIHYNFRGAESCICTVPLRRPISPPLPCRHYVIMYIHQAFQFTHGSRAWNWITNHLKFDELFHVRGIRPDLLIL